LSPERSEGKSPPAFCTGPFAAFVVQSLNILAQNILNGAWLTTLYEKLLARKYDPVLFSTALQSAFVPLRP
jgi:hypothetical protein